jgi:hypothetical protein
MYETTVQFNVWSETSSDWNTDDNCITTRTNSQDVPNCNSELSITNPRNSSITAIRRFATAYLWNWIPRISHLLRADLYYGGFDNGVMPPTFQMVINATVVTNISSSLIECQVFLWVLSANPRQRDHFPPPPRFKQFRCFRFCNCLAAENTLSSFGNTTCPEIDTFGHRIDSALGPIRPRQGTSMISKPYRVL